MEKHDAYVDDVLLDILLGFLAEDVDEFPDQGLADPLDEKLDLDGGGVSVFRRARTPREEARPVLTRLRGLPTDRGGLGIVRLAGVAGDIACLKSRQLVLDYLRANVERGTMSRWLPHGTTRWSEIVLGRAEEQSGLTHPFDHYTDRSSDVDETATSDPGAEPQSLPQTLDDQVKLVQKVYADIFASLQSMLSAEDRKAELAWLRSNDYPGSGKWLLSGSARGVYYGHLRFYGEEFRNALRLRCMVNPLPLLPNCAHLPICACGTIEKPVFLDGQPFHALDCRHGCINKANVTRHDRVRDVLADVIINYCGIHKSNVHKEATVGPLRGPARLRRRADLVVTIPGVRDNVFIDVAVVNPAAKTYLQKGLSHIRSGGASTCRANEKVEYYRRAGMFVIPFVVEATGRLGYQATGFLKHLAEISHVNWRSLRRQFLQKAGIGIQRANGSAVSAVIALKKSVDVRGLHGLLEFGSSAAAGYRSEEEDDDEQA